MRTTEKVMAGLLILWLVGFLVADGPLWGAVPMLTFALVMGALHALGWMLRGWIWLDRRLRR